ncbi:MAG: MBOAT family protein [Clostridia bacterium]|nr:MBOAT family protein [Clostridia bacterium]
MVFSSILFMFIYLPCVLGIYYALPKKFRNGALFLLNLIFYGWGEPIYITIMLLSTVIDYTHGILVETNLAKGNVKRAKLWVSSSIFFNLLLLTFFKYFDFIIGNILAIAPNLPIKPLGLPLPIGISFYTFQTMSYTIDVFRGDAKAQRNIFAFGSFVTLFPQLIAGPIIKYKDVDDQLTHRKESVEKFAKGVETFMAGLCKKALLANNIGPLWDSIYATNMADQSVLSLWLGIIAFVLQLYFDFSGYSDMARGLGRMLGFEFMENFNYPFISKSITEFWRRWHISLGSWFREYVYIPLGGNRCSKARNFFNIFVVWATTGIWHGASWNFLVWGLIFAVLLMFEKGFLLKKLQKAPGFIAHCYTLFFVLLSFVFFAIEGMGAGLEYMGGMFGLKGLPLINADFLYNIRNYGALLVLLFVGATPVVKNTFYKIRENKNEWLVPVLCAIGLIISTAYLVDASYNPFLYFRF